MSLKELLAIVACFGVGYWIVARLMTKEGQGKPGAQASDAQEKGPESQGRPHS